MPKLILKKVRDHSRAPLEGPPPEVVALLDIVPDDDALEVVEEHYHRSTHPAGEEPRYFLVDADSVTITNTVRVDS